MPSTDTIFKILHMSDLHLGKSLRAQDLAEDQAYVLGQIVRRAEELEPDLVIISGDVFDRSIPSEGAQTMFGRFMADLRRACWAKPAAPRGTKPAAPRGTKPASLSFRGTMTRRAASRLQRNCSKRSAFTW